MKSLGNRIRNGFRITAVTTSQATETLARRLAVPLIPFQRLSSVDLTIDGVDEIDHRFQGINGGGALLREKVIAAASTRVIVIVDSSKLVPQLGNSPCQWRWCPLPTSLPVHAWPNSEPASLFARSMGRPFSRIKAITSWTRPWTRYEIAASIAAIPSVVEHGLFPNEFDTTVIARGDMVDVRHREQA